MRPTAAATVGTPVHLDFRKYDGSEHWQVSYQLLQVDDFGVWVWRPAGGISRRPGVELVNQPASIRLISDRGFAASFTEAAATAPRAIIVYVDVATEPQWRHDGDGYVATMIDLDLDVIERVNGDIFVADEDEFAEHQVKYSYPAEVVSWAERACAEVLASVRNRVAPFDGRGHALLSEVSP